jgi:hypothetical protein
MKKISVFVLIWLGSYALGRATSVLPALTDQQIGSAKAIFRGTAVNIECYQDSDGFIYTRSVWRVDEVFKGNLPACVNLVHRGGEVPGRGEIDDFAPQFKAGEEWLVFVSRRTDGTLFSSRGQASAFRLAAAGDVAGLTPGSSSATGADLLKQLRAIATNGPLPGSDVTDQAASLQDQAGQILRNWQLPNNPAPMANPSSAATNLLTNVSGIPARFLQPDRGEPIPYLIDADYLPASMTQTQAVSAVQSALAAWAGHTSLRYQFAGIQSFGMAAPDVNNDDGVLRIQLHDHYNFIGSGTGSGDILGEGGHGWVEANSPSGWTTGGNVAGSDFHRVSNGYIVLAHTNAFMQNLTNFAEVLCHEIGHTIGLAHSSQDPNETNLFLKQAIMYYLAHDNGRGATLNGWDTNVVRQVHPPNNTPPYCYSRVIDAVSSPNAFTTSNVNTIQMRGYDLQGGPLTLITNDALGLNGSFSLLNSNLTYIPRAWFLDSGRYDPAGNQLRDIIYARYYDGTNASPYTTIKVISLNSDSFSEGIPDYWRLAFFGSANPTNGLKHHATDDADGDGFNNITEWRLGSNPTNSSSNLRITSFSPLALQWPAKGYEVYELYGSTNLIDWIRVMNPLVPTNFIPGTNLLNLTNSIGIATGFTNGAPWQFFRIQKVP